jgi:hypothetical protein
MPFHPTAPVLLFGPYQLPALAVGARTHCLVRDALVVVTSWSDARFSWPFCRTVGQRGGSAGLLVEDELARAIKSESALALMYWWGVTKWTVWNWRKLLGVEGPAGTPGSQRLIQAAARRGAEAMRAREFTEAEREQRRRQALEQDQGRYLVPGYHGPRWTPEERALLGTMPDAELAKRIGKSETAVRNMRWRMGIAKHDSGSC